MEKTLNYGVFPLLVFIGEQLSVHSSHGLFYAGRSVAVEIDRK